MTHSISPSTKKKDTKIENVLVLQGGGSLGAFGCGVYKALAQDEINIDIAAGTSIGGVNAAIIAGAKSNNEKRPEELLEEFWLEIADSYVDVDNSSHLIIPLLQQLISNYYNYSLPSNQKKNSQMMHSLSYRNKSISSFLSAAVFGVNKMFVPRWGLEYSVTDPEFFEPAKWTYLYDHSPLVKTLEKYINYDKLRPKGNPYSRLIMTAVNVLTSEPLTFDSFSQQITPKHILATCGYSSYNFSWVEVEKGVYAWDGSLLSNTPLREVIDASPVNDKRIFLVENYPKRIESLPENLPEVYHRTRDIIFCDKTLSTVQMSKVITRYLRYIDELYQVIESSVDMSKVDKKQLETIRKKYRRYKEETGAEIKGVYYISREESHHSIYENADFSPRSIKTSIKDGERKTKEVISKIEKDQKK